MQSEFDLIQKIDARFCTPDGVTLGIGDDSAVLDPGRFDLVTTDTMVEGIHFRRDWSTPFDVGWKLLATNLSDIAAMGGGPGVFFLNLSFPQDLDDAFLDGFLDGLAQASKDLVPESFHVSVGGGDVTKTHGPIVLSATLLGESSPAGPVLRTGAVPGDRVVVFGHLGLAAGGLALLESGKTELFDSFPTLLQAHRRPRPRVHEGGMMGLYGVPSSLIDVSDGLIQDLGHVLACSQVGASIEVHSLPVHLELLELQKLIEFHPLERMLTGGDDYELLVTVPPARMPKLWELARRYGWNVYDIGEVRSKEEGLRVLDPRGNVLDSLFSGYEHFKVVR